MAYDPSEVLAIDLGASETGGYLPTPVLPRGRALRRP